MKASRIPDILSLSNTGFIGFKPQCLIDLCVCVYIECPSFSSTQYSRELNKYWGMRLQTHTHTHTQGTHTHLHTHIHGTHSKPHDKLKSTAKGIIRLCKRLGSSTFGKPVHLSSAPLSHKHRSFLIPQWQLSAVVKASKFRVVQLDDSHPLATTSQQN